MASIRVLKSKTKVESFQVRWWEGGGQPSATFELEETAVAFRGILEAHGPAAAFEWLDRFEGGGAPAGEGVPSVDELVAHHIKHLTGIDEGTRDEYRRMYARTWSSLWLEESPLGRFRLGALPADVVDRDVAAHAQNRLAAGGSASGAVLSPKSIANCRGLVSHAFAVAVDSERWPSIRKNPWRGLRLPQQQLLDEDDDGHEMLCLTPAEFDLILGELPEHWHPLIFTKVLSGLRWGEVSALAVRHARLDEQLLRVRRAWKRCPGGSRLGPPKSKAGRRDVTFAPELVEVLRPLVAGRDQNALLFTSPNGCRVYRDHFSMRVWRPAIHRAQRCPAHRELVNPCGCRPRAITNFCKTHRTYPQPCLCPGTLTRTPRLHDLRHTHVSWLVAAGIPAEVIQPRVGHESLETTMRVYRHLLPDVQAHAAAAAGVALATLNSGGAARTALAS